MSPRVRLLSRIPNSSKTRPIRKELELLTLKPRVILHLPAPIPNINTHLIQHQPVVELARARSIADDGAIELIGDLATGGAHNA